MYRLRIGNYEGIVEFQRIVETKEEVYEEIKNSGIKRFSLIQNHSEVINLLLKELNIAVKGNDIEYLNKVSNQIAICTRAMLENDKIAYVVANYEDGLEREVLVDLEFYLNRDGRAIVHSEDKMITVDTYDKR